MIAAWCAIDSKHVAGERAGVLPTDDRGDLPVGLAGVHEVGTSGDVDDGLGERLVQRDEGVAVAADADLVAERFAQCLAEADRGVLDGVVRVDVDVALGTNREVDQRVARERGEHVVVETDTGGDVADAGTVEIQLDDDMRLGGLSLDAGSTTSSRDLL